MDERSYYLIKKIDKDMTYNGISIPSGYYRVDYNLSGTQVEYAEITACVLPPIKILHFDIIYRN